MSNRKLPIIRFGEPYYSMDKKVLIEPSQVSLGLEMGIANSGLIRRDILKSRDKEPIGNSFSVKQLISFCNKAAEIFKYGSISLGGFQQSSEEFVLDMCHLSKLPISLCKNNIEKIYLGLKNIEEILNGLMRGLPFDFLDFGEGLLNHSQISFRLNAKNFGVVLPNNSPGVNTLWLPSVPLKVPVMIRPGSDEPMTPFRIIASLIQAGCPKELFCYYPSEHDGSREIIQLADKSLLFGDEGTVREHKNNPNIEVHGPGFSKVIIGQDEIENWQNHLTVLIDSVSKNSGRSCINASTIIVPKYGKEIAEKIAMELAKMKPMDPLDDASMLASFKNELMADWISEKIKEGLEIDGAEDISSKFRDGDILVKNKFGNFVQPTVIFSEDPGHPLSFTEFMMPYVCVLELKEQEALQYLEPALVLSCISKDQEFLDKIKRLNRVDRLNVGSIPTCAVDWSQPHEGNLFEFLYTRKSYTKNTAGGIEKGRHEVVTLGSKLYSGANSIQNLREIIKGGSYKKIVIVTDKLIEKNGHVSKIVGVLKDLKIEYFVYSESKENPTETDAQLCGNFLKDSNAELIIGVGGGSSLDTAKGGNYIATNGGRMRDYWGYAKNNFELLPMVAIPTTAGTGSETQSYALISHDDTHQKMACGTPSCMPIVTILDPVLTITQPQKIACLTALDTIGHALETAVTNKKSLFSSMLSLQSFRFVFNNFDCIFKDLQNLNKRLGLQLGAYYAGLAIENSMLGLAHSMANPITKYLGIPHGQAVGLCLPEVVLFNSKNQEACEIYSNISQSVGLEPEALALSNEIRRFYKQSNFAKIDFNDDLILNKLIEETFQQWTLQFNPIMPTNSELRFLYESVFQDV